jgi:hypothetical protein
MQAFIIYASVSSSQYRTGPRTIAKRDWSTPNACSTFFFADSCLLAKYFLFAPNGIGIVLTKVDQLG